MTKRNGIFAGLCFVVLQASVGAQLIEEKDHIQIDGTKIAFSRSIEVEGVGCDRDELWHQSTGQGIHAWRINGKATQEKLIVHLYPSQNGEMFVPWAKIDKGAHLRIRGRLTDAKVGGSQNIFVVRAESVDSIKLTPLGPADFVERAATFQGLAIAGGQVQGKDFVLNLDGIEE